jgi:hypothetical protein
MNRLFDGHPQCFTYPSELALGGADKSVWPDLSTTGSAKAAFDLMTQRSLNWVTTSMVEGFRKDGVGSSQAANCFVFNASDFQRVFNESLAHHSKPSAREYLNAYHTAFFNCWVDNQVFYRPEKKFVVAFTPRVNFRPENYERYWECYPDGYWISVIRDPGSWYASARRHSGRYHDFAEAIAVWRQSAEASLNLKRRFGDRTILLSFEGLVAQTEPCMRMICERTGLDWDPTLLVPSFNGVPVASNSSFSGRKGIDVSATERTSEEFLSRAQQESLEELRSFLQGAEGDFDFR